MIDGRKFSRPKCKRWPAKATTTRRRSRILWKVTVCTRGGNGSSSGSRGGGWHRTHYAIEGILDEARDIGKDAEMVRFSKVRGTKGMNQGWDAVTTAAAAAAVAAAAAAAIHGHRGYVMASARATVPTQTPQARLARTSSDGRAGELSTKKRKRTST